MGHLRLRGLPDTAPWRRVVGHVADGADAATVATATTEAANEGIVQAYDDPAFCHVPLLLSRLALAARETDFVAALRVAGVRVNGPPTVVELTSALGAAIEAHVRAGSSRTASDVGEMARLAAVESVTRLLTNRSRGLFATTPDEVQSAARGFSTRAGFAILFHDYFASFTRRFLTYHLGRELSLHVGGNGRFADVADHTRFVNDLDHHCRQAALIVKDFAGDWYDKHNFLGGVTPRKAKGFANYCLTKLKDELLIRGGQPWQTPA